MVYRWLHGQAPRYLADHLIPASDAAPRRGRLRSANRNRLTVPRCRLSSTYGCQAFHYAGPTVWNSLPDELRNSYSFDSFNLNGSWLFSLAASSLTSALEVIFYNEMRNIKSTFYLLTYLLTKTNSMDQELAPHALGKFQQVSGTSFLYKILGRVSLVLDNALLLLLFPHLVRFSVTTIGRRGFALSDPATWNSTKVLPPGECDFNSVHRDICTKTQKCQCQCQS